MNFSSFCAFLTAPNTVNQTFQISTVSLNSNLVIKVAKIMQ